LFVEMERVARGRLDADGFAPGARRLERSLDLRYVGQAFEIAVPVAAPLDAAAIAREFHRRHEASYGHANLAGRIEMVNARLAAYGVVMKPEPERFEERHASAAPAIRPRLESIARRDVWFERVPVACPVYDRDRLPVDGVIPGPAIVEEFGATTVLPPGWRATVDALGNLRLERA
jgi:N-methylhydantoinase A